MTIQEWFCVCLFFKLFLVFSNADSPPKMVLQRTPSGNINKDALIQEIVDLMDQFQNAINVQEKLPDEVVITQGRTTILEYFKSWIFPGYQPEAIGTAANPLIQHTFKRFNTGDGSVPTYGVAEIAPTNTPQVKEPSRYINPKDVTALKKSAGQIVQDIQNSPEKFRFT